MLAFWTVFMWWNICGKPAMPYQVGGLPQTLNKRPLKAFQRKVRQDAIRYVDNQRKWRHDDEYLKAGYPIDSGVVESTCATT